MLTAATASGRREYHAAMQGSGDATALPIYGRIDKIGTAIMVSGDQTDGLQATLSWAVG